MAGPPQGPAPQAPATPRKGGQAETFAERVDVATLLQIWETLQFLVPDLLAAGLVGSGELGCAWLWAVERRSGAMEAEERAAIIAFVSAAVRSMLKANEQRSPESAAEGKYGVDAVEWLYRMMCWHCGAGAARAAGQLKGLLDVALRRRPQLLDEEMPGAFSRAQARTRATDGRLSFLEAVRTCSDVLWGFRGLGLPTLEDDWGLNEPTPDQFINCIVDCLVVRPGVGEKLRVTYEQFMACCLGRRKQEVLLNMYDITNGMAQAFSSWVPMRDVQAVEGLWHTGVVAFGREYSFAGNLVHSAPGDCGIGKPKKFVVLGTTWRRMAELHRYVYDELRTVYSRETYDLLRCNCNHFSDHISRWLCGRHIPDEVRRQPELATQIPVAIAGMFGGALNEWFRSRGGTTEVRSASPARPAPSSKEADGETEALAEELPEMCNRSPGRSWAGGAKDAVSCAAHLRREPPIPIYNL